MPATLTAKRHPIADVGDAIEFCFQQGWTDGLPVIPPTEERVLSMLKAAIFTFGRPDDLVTDQGSELTALDFQKFLRRRSIGHRLGAVRQRQKLAISPQRRRSSGDVLGRHAPPNRIEVVANP